MGVKIEINNIDFSYDRDKVLESINVSIDGDHLIGMIGKNGVGKTTLLHLIAGEFPLSDGKVTVDGKNPARDMKVKQNMVFLHAGISYPKGFSLAMIGEYYRACYPTFDEEFANKLFSYFDINQKRKMSQFSLGVQSMIKAIFSLATRAKLTILDEPVIGMDIGARKQFYDILLRDFMEYPRTIIISSHMLNEMESILDKIIILKNKTVAFYCDMEELKESEYRVEGEKSVLEEIVHSYEVKKSCLSELTSYLIVDDSVGDMLYEEYKGISLTRRSVSDICVDLLEENGNRGLDELWSKEKMESCR